MFETAQLDGRYVVIDGVAQRYFAGTGYLGLAHNVDFQSLLQEGTRRYGATFSASRNGLLRLEVYDAAEAWLSDYTQSEAALTFSSGMLAGQLLVKSLQDAHFIYASGAHPAIWNATPHPSNTLLPYADILKQLETLIQDVSNNHIVLAFNAIDPLYCQKISWEWVPELTRFDKKITLLVDDSHGLGIIGEDGAGTYSLLRQQVPESVELIVVASLGKGLSVSGGVVLGNTARIKTLRQSPFFGASSPIAPASLYALLHSRVLQDTARQKLQNSIQYFQENCPLQLQSLENYPVFYCQNSALYQHLLAQKIIVSAIHYPSVDAPLLVRIVLSALHEEADLQDLCKAMEDF